jgi:hypothetical protein
MKRVPDDAADAALTNPASARVSTKPSARCKPSEEIPCGRTLQRRPSARCREGFVLRRSARSKFTRSPSGERETGTLLRRKS